VLPKRLFSRLGVFCCIVAVCSAAQAADEVDAFRVYSWSSLETADPDTVRNCKAIDKGKKEIGWCSPRREVADVSELEPPEDQKQGTAYRIFVDYCVRLDGSRERPVGAMIFRAAPTTDPDNVKRWGTRHYHTTGRSSTRKPKPGREHFNPPNFDR